MFIMCGEYAPGEVTYTCPQDGGNLDVVLDLAGIKKQFIRKIFSPRMKPPYGATCRCCRSRIRGVLEHR